MATIKKTTDFADNVKNFGEGRLNTESMVHIPAPASTFVRMIVKEVISDPNNDLKDEAKRAKWQGMGIKNIDKFINILPRNTIIAKKVGEDVNSMFVFPFFPSHISMPCKPGECVWVMFEKPDAPDSEMAFWFCRIVEPHVADDVNHSHSGRAFEKTLSLRSKDRVDAELDGTSETGEHVWHELRNGPVVSKGDDRITGREAVILKGEPDDIFESLITMSDASKLMTYEAVPRFRKRPGDVVLEGSNNTLFVLGTERSGSLEKSKFFEAGSVDIVAGRGQTEATLGKEASTTWTKDASGKTKGTTLKKELNKSLDHVVPNEGDPDLKNDRSRILLSQKTAVDENFNLNLKDYNSKKGLVDSSEGDAAIVIKSDKIRLIARSDIEILVTGFTPGSTSNNQSKKDQNDDTKKWASILIKSNGDIVLTPADEGLLKLGGDDANLAILCSPSMPVKPGEVTAPPISTTMGGQVGVAGSAALGVWASKILVK